ncbi:MAG: hypothetical protein ACFFDK_14405 [Promethearchaeota archaeon]
MVNYKAIIKDLQKKYSDASKVAIISKDGKNLFSTDNWNISSDIKSVLSNWASGNAQFVSIDGIRYSILQMEPERFIATNRHNQGHLIGATSPDGTICILAHIKPKAKAWYHSAYPFVARAAAMMAKGSKSKSLEIKTSKKKSKIKKRKKEAKAVLLDATGEESNTYENTNFVIKEGPQIDPYLKLEIENFLQWINDPNGLSSYISYYLTQNDQEKIQALAIIYKTLHRILSNE